ARTALAPPVAPLVPDRARRRGHRGAGGRLPGGLRLGRRVRRRRRPDHGDLGDRRGAGGVRAARGGVPGRERGEGRAGEPRLRPDPHHGRLPAAVGQRARPVPRVLHRHRGLHLRRRPGRPHRPAARGLRRRVHPRPVERRARRRGAGGGAAPHRRQRPGLQHPRLRGGGDHGGAHHPRRRVELGGVAGRPRRAEGRRPRRPPPRRQLAGGRRLPVALVPGPGRRVGLRRGRDVGHDRLRRRRPGPGALPGPLHRGPARPQLPGPGRELPRRGLPLGPAEGDPRGRLPAAEPDRADHRLRLRRDLPAPRRRRGHRPRRQRRRRPGRRAEPRGGRAVRGVPGQPREHAAVLRADHRAPHPHRPHRGRPHLRGAPRPDAGLRRAGHHHPRVAGQREHLAAVQRHQRRAPAGARGLLHRRPGGRRDAGPAAVRRRGARGV
ncbi:MAG: hypothetical protein AVDCRST_MAG35-611, partial [uncultured Quadrisphaera sp.]